MVGLMDGSFVGSDGDAEVGETDGNALGEDDGFSDGDTDGCAVGVIDGSFVVGDVDGDGEDAVGDNEGC